MYKRQGFRTRVDLKIQDGCDNTCSYCIVHVARGPARSVPAATVISRARTLADAGTRELVLVGIDLAAYRDADIDLARLVTLLQEKTDIGRVRVSSVEPQSVTPTLVDVLAHSEGRLCRHLHLCLQSGSDKVLREMNRRYDADAFCALANRLHEAVPRIALSTDVIVGFPGETEDDFARTCKLVERCGFMRLHVFRYSKRPGTPAAKMCIRDRRKTIPAAPVAPCTASTTDAGTITMAHMLSLIHICRALRNGRTCQCLSCDLATIGVVVTLCTGPIWDTTACGPR